MHLKMASPISSTFSIVKDIQVLKCNPIEEYLIVNPEVSMKEEEWCELDTLSSQYKNAHEAWQSLFLKWSKEDHLVNIWTEESRKFPNGLRLRSSL